MILYLMLILIYNVVQNFFHKAIIAAKSSLWHTMSAIQDSILWLILPILISEGSIKVWHWTEYLFLLMIPLWVRWISRDIMIGVGTTVWMDRNIRGWYRVSAHMFFAFWAFVYIHGYFTSGR